MNDAQTILNLIKTIDPNDTAKLDEIDARVWCYVRGHKYVKHNHKRVWVEKFGTGYPDNGRWFDMDYDQADASGDYEITLVNPFFTRSRDALKAIRPAGHISGVMDYSSLKRASGFCRVDHTMDGAIYTAYLPTEELAELHAIIQAIAYERGQK